MALIKPFAALRPQPELAGKICELPYDVMSSDEARALAAGNPLSFLHVSKPEIDLPADVDAHDARVYAKGRENFVRLMAQHALRQDLEPAFYLYRQIMGQHAQTGLVAAASCQDYLDNIVKKHELTRPDKEDDRVRHIETLDSQTGPVFLVCRAVKAVDDLVTRVTAQAPDTDFTAADGVRHSAWAVRGAEQIELVQRTFARIPHLYIADGHHRCAAAARVFKARQGAGESGFFLSVIFPDNQVRILPYNRVLKDLNGLTAAGLLEKLKGVFEIKSPAVMDRRHSDPVAKNDLGLYLEGRWHGLRFRPELAAARDAVSGLDVTLLQEHVLAPIFGIDNPRTSQRVNFVGGIRGADELEKLVNTKEYACAFAMFPTGIGDLMAIADAGGIMPPKSTWFEPKLRDAMFCHLLSR
jgi:uncharacterized protein (DUF1015 family)